LALEGGCRVAGLREGEPVRDGDLRIWNHFRGVNVALRVIEGRGTLRNENVDEVLYDIGRDAGVYLAAATELAVDGTYVAVAAPGRAEARPHIEPHPAIQQTGDRSYQELIQSDITQFVGSIPPGRAPDHFHHYEEMLCILDGYGTMWAGTTSAPIERGSCIYLPRRQVHCVENRSSGALRLLGVFYPAGSPAVRYGVHDRAEDGPEER
jgi:mannose-6-phosphate isomerase-like protein (cupin superfamily)